MDTRWTPHVTVAALIEREGRYLLVEEHTREGLRLNNPAGHLEPGETPVQGCVREALEETTHRFTPTHLVGVYLTRSSAAAGAITYLRLAFAGDLGPAVAGRSLDAGIERTLWLSPHELRAQPERLRSPLVLRCIEDHQRGARWPLAMVHCDPSALLPL